MSMILQNINNVQTQGHPAVADPCVSVYHKQQHIAYRDKDGLIWDSWYDGEGGWHLQQINGFEGQTSGPVAFAGPFINVFNDQQHFVYLEKNGNIWDSWYDGQGSWKPQQLNNVPITDNVPRAFIDTRPGAPLPVVAVWNYYANDPQQHFTYLSDVPDLWECFWDSGNSSDWPGVISIPALWQNQSFADLGVKPGSSPVVGVFGNQEHVVYVEETTGLIVDHWYNGDSQQWNFQRITGGLNSTTNSTVRTSGLPTLLGTLPTIWVDHTNTQQHFTYVGVDRAIYDAFWTGNGWELQKLTQGGKTNGPAAWSGVSVCNYQPEGSDNTVYVAYRDDVGTIWTVAYSNGRWLPFQIKDLPFGATNSTVDLPPAAGNVILWVDGSGNQLHCTFRSMNRGPLVSPLPPVAVEARLAIGTRLHPTTSPADVVLASSTASGVILDFFYEP